MTEEEQRILIGSIGTFVKEQLAPLKERIAVLEQTLGEFGYRGTWNEGIVFHSGNFVTLGGSLWHCQVSETTSRPSTDNPDWSLAVKRGRDGKRAPDYSTEPRKPTAPRPTVSN